MESDLINRQMAINTIMEQPPEPHYPIWYAEQIIALPSAQSYTEAEIQRMQDLEQAQIEKAYQLGYEEGKKDAEQQERKIGKWERTFISVTRDKKTSVVKCSECGCMQLIEYPFCGGCGAKMEGEGHD